jgi:hypothetical protein
VIEALGLAAGHRAPARVGDGVAAARRSGADQEVNFLPSAAMRSSSGEIVKSGPISLP